MSKSESAISRRDFIRSGAMSAVGLAALQSSGLAEATRPPNILYIFSDMQQATSMGCYGDPNVRTPALDAFARQGARFDAAMSNTPVCCPHRACLQTGLYSHHHGVVSNSVQFTRKTRGLAEQFQAAGYVTGYAGKWHIPGGYGSEHSNPLGFPPAAPRGLVHGGPGARAHCVRVNGKETYIPTVLSDNTIRFIEEKSKNQAPWVFFLSWLPPHSPYVAPPEHRAHYQGKLQLRPNVPSGASMDYARAVMPDYYGMVESLDAEFKRIMDALNRAGVAEDTIVCYSSDHGDMLGAHGYKAKRWPLEESVRVPLLIRYPRAIRPAQVFRQPFSTVDVYPTLAGLGGLKPPSGLDGMDYSALVTGKSRKAPRDSAFLQMMYAYVPWPGWRAIRTEEYSYARTGQRAWLLHNLLKDPYQMKNLVDDPSSRTLLAEMDRRLAALMKESGDSWDYKATTGDIDAWLPGGAKQRSQNLGVPWPGAKLDGPAEGGGGKGRKKRRKAQSVTG